MALVNLSGDAEEQTETYEQLGCEAGRADEIRNQIIFLLSINIFLSLTAFLGNTLILVALQKESSLHPPSKLMYRCLTTTDLCVGLISEPVAVFYWLSLLHEDWNLCLIAETSRFVAGYILSSVSLLTMTAISVDRLLALLLGLRYRQAVTLKRIYSLLSIFWITSFLTGISYFVKPRIAFRSSQIGIPLCLITATFSYLKIFHRLHYNQNQVQMLALQQSGQQVPLNMTRYREAAYSALWVHGALVVCFLPFGILTAILPKDRMSPSEFLIFEWAGTFIYLNSSLNPFLYCWKIIEVRQAVKETVRQLPRCPWSSLQS